MHIIQLTSLNQPGVEVYSTLTETQLRNKLHPEQGIFIAESPKVIRVALEAGFTPLSLLCEERHITGDAADIIAQCGDITVYTGERELLTRLTGYTLTRGVLCAMGRPHPRSVEEVCKGATRVCVINGVVDTTCDRCLDPMEIDIEAERELIVKFGSEYREESDEVLVIPEQDGVLDLEWLLYEDIVLSLPMQRLHDEGDCNEEMMEIIHGVQSEEVDGTAQDAGEDEEESMIDERWAALKELKRD